MQSPRDIFDAYGKKLFEVLMSKTLCFITMRTLLSNSLFLSKTVLVVGIIIPLLEVNYDY